MPYKIIQEQSGYYVEDVKSHRKLSKKGLSKKQARKQEVAVALAEHRKTGKPVKQFFG
jgi:hypothetical protein